MSVHPMSASDTSLRDAALAHAKAGHPVIPLRPRDKRRCTPKGTKPSTDPATVRRWWTRWPDANVGAVLDRLPVVVLDVDGPDGVVSLARLLAQAGLEELPDTYTVTTGRPDGGRHHCYRLPPGAVKLVNQLGQYNPTTPRLDVLFQGLTVAAGSVHKSGAIYTASMTEVPEPSALTELPTALYEVLARRGRPRVSAVASHHHHDAKRLLVQERSAITVVPPPRVLPRYVVNLLNNFSDGRNTRTLMAVTALLRLGLDDRVVIDTVLACPLGGKALEEAHPRVWLQEKIDAARAYRPPSLDREGFWQAVHTSGMSASHIRVLDTLLSRATAGGVVCMSQAWIGLDSAVSSPAGVVRTLIERGWMVVREPPTTDYPAIYRLTIPDPGLDAKSHPPICPSTPYLLSPQWDLRVVFPVEHDAFRCNAGSLHSAYPLLSLLSSEPQDLDTLARWLRVKPRVLQDRTESLVAAGVAALNDRGVALTNHPVGPLLHAVAVKAGTDGSRRRAIKAYKAKCAKWRQARAEAGEVGSPTWRKMRRDELLARMSRGGFSALLEHLGDVDAAVTYLVDSEIAARTQVDEDFVAFLAATDDRSGERAQ
jgi:hypothetical protein